MRCVFVVLSLVVTMTLGLLVIIQSRKTMELQLTKTSYFENIKHKVTVDVLKEYNSNIGEAKFRLDQIKKQVADLLRDVKSAQESADGKTAELNTCNTEMTQITTDIGTLEAEKNRTGIQFHQNMANLEVKIKNLQIETERRSKVCDYIIKSSVGGMKLCGIVPVLQAEQKPEAIAAG